ncbi:MAG: PspC domain-containing protein [Solirubrobacteraceae bacterium]|jgi:phage shock protein PspC (stress-responsive transcriptional regulator)
MNDTLPNKPSTRVGRVRRGRWLTGVCAGLAPVLRVHAAWVRAAFVALGLVGGLGVALYLACWLIFSAEDEGAETVRRGGVIALAQACAGAIALTALGLLGALSTVFGFGWIILAFATLLLAGWLAASRRLGPAWVSRTSCCSGTFTTPARPGRLRTPGAKRVPS